MIDIARRNHDAGDSEPVVRVLRRVYRVKTWQKGRVAKRGGRGRKRKRFEGREERLTVRRRTEDKARRNKKSSTSVWTHESQILRRAGACMMFLFTGAPTHAVSPPLFPFRVARSCASGIARLAPSHTRRRCSFFRSLGRSIVSVTRTLCEAASIKPHFYSGALHSLRPLSGSFLSPATSHFCPRRPFASFATHILWTRANAQESNGVPLHPVARVRLCGHAGSIYQVSSCTYIHTL